MTVVSAHMSPCNTTTNHGVKLAVKIRESGTAVDPYLFRRVLYFALCAEPGGKRFPRDCHSLVPFPTVGTPGKQKIAVNTIYVFPKDTSVETATWWGYDTWSYSLHTPSSGEVEKADRLVRSRPVLPAGSPRRNGRNQPVSPADKIRIQSSLVPNNAMLNSYTEPNLKPSLILFCVCTISPLSLLNSVISLVQVRHL